jgi:hypothetical protein
MLERAASLLPSFHAGARFRSEPVLDALWAAFDQLSVPVLILSASGRILFANRAANDMPEAGWPIRLLDRCLQKKDHSVSAALKQAMDLVSSSDQGGAIAELRPLTFDDAKPAIALFIMRAGQTSHRGIDGLAEAFGF